MTIHVDLEAMADGHAVVMRVEAGGDLSRPIRVTPEPIPAGNLVAAGLLVQVGPFDV
jgi:hypothetical protein